MSVDWDKIEALHVELNQNHVDTDLLLKGMLSERPNLHDNKRKLKNRYAALITRAKELHDALTEEFSH